MARKLGINLEIIEVKDQSELADAFDRMGARGVAGVALVPDAVFAAHARTIAELARIHKLPVVGTDAIFCSCGGPVCFLRRLFGYGTTFCMACGPNLKGNGPWRFGGGTIDGIQALR